MMAWTGPVFECTSLATLPMLAQNGKGKERASENQVVYEGRSASWHPDSFGPA